MGPIWCEGYQAFYRKVWVQECPYPPETVAGIQWYSGWMFANRDPYEKT